MLVMALSVPDDLDGPRKIMYEELAKEHDAAPLDQDLSQIVQPGLTNPYDNQTDAEGGP